LPNSVAVSQITRRATATHEAAIWNCAFNRPQISSVFPHGPLTHPGDLRGPLTFAGTGSDVSGWNLINYRLSRGLPFVPFPAIGKRH
jgi:hypothetical protein